MNTFNQQFNFRVDNQLKLLFELRNGPLSLNDLAKRIGVSFTAIVKIVEQLKNEGVLTFTKKQKTNRKGRKPSFVKINTKVGVTCAIDFAGEKITVVISDLRNRILISKDINGDFFIDQNSLGHVIETIQLMLKEPVVENRPLLSVCIAAPGMINKDTGEFFQSFKLKNLQCFSINNYFFNRLGVPVYIYNDVKIGLVGERMFGCIPVNASHYMFVHIGSGCSVSIAIDGKLYQGAHGYSGELSSYKDNDFFKPAITNNHLEDLALIAIRLSKKYPDLNISNDGFAIDVNGLLGLIEKGDKRVVDEVAENARRNAIQLIAYNDILDLEYIVISGTILKIGDFYKKCLLDAIFELNGKPLSAKILFSQLDNPSLYGAIYQANNLYFLKKLEEITNEKSSANEYDISEAFGSNI